MNDSWLDWAPLALAKTVLGGLFGVLAAAWFGLGPVAHLLGVLMVADVVTGVLVALNRGELSSSASFKGMTKKAAALVLFGLAWFAETELALGFPLAEVVAGFYCATEALSIFENAAALGLPVPQQLRDLFAKLGSEPPRPVGGSKP